MSAKIVKVFLDTGLQRFFIPLRKHPVNFTAPAAQYPKADGKGGTNTVLPPQDLVDAIRDIEDWDVNNVIPEDTRQKLDSLFSDYNSGLQHPELVDMHKWLKARFGEKSWTLPDGNVSTLCGIWLLVETNTADGEGKGGPAQVFDRGLFYTSNEPNAREKAKALKDYAEKRSPAGGYSPYVEYEDANKVVLDFSKLPMAANVGLDLGDLSIVLVFTRPAAAIHDVDLILDLGNTRTAALLFDHVGKVAFAPMQFRQNFRPLRIKPDPTSGEYGALNEVEAGIADSWFVLHELDHQRYRVDTKLNTTPDLLLRELNLSVKEKISKIWLLFEKHEQIVEGHVTERIPQMFMQISPVVIGDAAYRLFNLPYAREMAKTGKPMQQSSPKRFYWDGEQTTANWVMLLNEWDPNYDENVAEAAFLPTIQGDICRFLDEKNGTVRQSVFDDAATTAQLPDAYPDEPRYPRRATLTWFLLHLLERAIMQVNEAFQGTQRFDRHRLRKVLVTYPSGWTDTEVENYRKCCKGALDIFSAVNVRHGVQSPERVELVARSETPDEAVAGQLPFIFSETIRYPGQSVGDWISTMGRRRGEDGNEADTVRVMNFDIGGGTTDISVIEYRDFGGDGTGLNDLSARLLFKDGRALAGDDLLKRIIEKTIIGRYAEKINPQIGGRIISIFSQAASAGVDQQMRSRIVRTCLMPLATYCLAHTGSLRGEVTFSAYDAGIAITNWKEFNDLLCQDGNDYSIPHDGSYFSFDSSEIADIIDETFCDLFRSCALYAAAYEVDMVVFSGKTSEQPHIREMAKRILPLEEERLLFGRSFKPGQWYPFTDKDGFISDAKTVTVVGAALYYALASGFINNWTITTARPAPGDVRNEWGVYEAMQNRGSVLLKKEDDTVKGKHLAPGQLLARRRNVISSPEPVCKIFCKDPDFPHRAVNFAFVREPSDDGMDEKLTISSVTDDDGTDLTDKFELKLHPCVDESAASFWQETGLFNNIPLTPPLPPPSSTP